MLRSTLVAAALILAAPAIASAQLGSTHEERAACRPDARRLCRAAMPRPSAVRACILANRTRLSPACRRIIEGAR